MKIGKQVSLVLFVILLVACAVTPTGRKQLSIIPESQLIVMGVQSFHEMQDKTPAVKDAKLQAYVQCVADTIINLPYVQRRHADWELVVFDGNEANAFALPGGKIGVYKGLLNVAQTPGQLAAVLGHEVGHVLAHHGNERVSQQFAMSQAMGLLEAWVMQGDAKNKELAMSLLGIGGQLGVILPFSRLHESEADEIGQELMAYAGFDPAESVALWQNMAKNGQANVPEFLSTHPSHGTRIDKLRKGAKQHQSIYQQAIAASGKPKCQPPA